MTRRGQLSSASSLTNLSSEPDYPPQRTRSASELLEHSSILSPARLRSRQRSRDLHLSLANSRSDYYNNRRPQSISLSSQIPAHSNLQSASSVLALGTISETDAAFRRSTNGPISTDSIFAEPPDTPLFHYHPTLSLTELATPTRGGSFRNSRLSHASSNQGPITAGAGHHQLNGTNSICYAYSPTPSAVAPMIHVSEPIAREFVALYLNPLTGQMYSHTQDYFRPIYSPKELLAKPPIPDKRLEEKQTLPPSYITFTQILAILFFVCGNFIVLAVCSLPALFCAQKVHQMNLEKRFSKAKKHSEYVLCFNILGLVLHVIMMLGVITTAIVLAVVLL